MSSAGGGARAVRAVVFAYHDVGVRCLRTLLAHGVDVPLVVTHADSAAETIWFASVEGAARERGIECMIPANVNAPEVVAAVRDAAPDFLFSFYCRQVLGADLLDAPARGALNVHGSLLPKYRGRVPVNWAVIRGERQTGATLHYMVAKPDAGDIVGQTSVPILPDDTAAEVLAKVTVAAEITLDRWLPALAAGTAPRLAQDFAGGSYFGGRRPEDGTIDWGADALTVHNLVRGVAPPYPGARTRIAGLPARVLRTLAPVRPSGSVAAPPENAIEARTGTAVLYAAGNRLFARCADDRELTVLSLEIDGHPLSPGEFALRFGNRPIPLPS